MDEPPIVCHYLELRIETESMKYKYNYAWFFQSKMPMHTLGIVLLIKSCFSDKFLMH